jgi:single-strand DNA-binding protein
MDANNVVVVRGVVSSEPRSRELSSGSVVTQLDVTTRGPALTASVPIAVFDRTVDVAVGDEVVVTGHVNRRFFRAGGITQSRTELIADDVVRVARKRTVEKMIAVATALVAGEQRPNSH